MSFKEVRVNRLDMNPFTKIGQEWMLISAGDIQDHNSMTASWGGFGVLWHKNVATVYVRPQRFTKVFIDTNDTFTLSFFGRGYRKELNYLGSVSGRDEDKVKNSGLTVRAFDGTAGYEEA
jgi:flavin reductase (DIM6/NTAB) family NADH-FMN oxidoreductase RutF